MNELNSKDSVTSDEGVAIEKALEKWRQLQNHLEKGGEVFEPSTTEALDQYIQYLEGLLESRQLKKHTISGKKTIIRKLSEHIRKQDV